MSRPDSTVPKTGRIVMGKVFNPNAIIENNADGILVIDKRGIVRYVNSAGKKFFDKWTDDPCGEIFGFPVVVGESAELNIIRNDGLISIAEMRAVETEWEGENVFLATLRDITERKKIEADLIRERMLSERLINSSVDGILAFDKGFRYIIWNPGMERISGKKKEEVLGRNAFDVFPFLKKTGEEQYFLKALGGKTAIAKNREYIIPETGEKGYYEAHYSSLRNELGEIIGGLAIIRDITFNKIVEEKYIGERNRAELYLDLLGHDINNLNQAIMAYNEILSKEQLLPEQYRRYAKNAFEQAIAIRKLIFNVQNLTELQKGQYKIKEPGIQKLFLEAWNLSIDFGKIDFVLIPRQQNKQADRLVNSALDKEAKSQKLL